MTARAKLIANVKRLRGERPVVDMAKKADIHKVTWWKIESGERFPRPEQLDRIAKSLGVKVSQLFE